MQTTKYLTLDDIEIILHKTFPNKDYLNNLLREGLIQKFQEQAEEAWLIVSSEALEQELDNGDYELGVESCKFIALKFESLKVEGLINDIDEYYESNYFTQHIEEMKVDMRNKLFNDWLADVTYEKIKSAVRDYIKYGE